MKHRSSAVAESLHYRFDKEFGPVQARRAAFRDAVAASVDIIFDREDNFSAELGFHQLGPIGLGMVTASPYTAVRTEETLQRATIDHVYIDCFPKAGFDGTMNGKRIRVEDGDCVVFDQTCLMRLEFDHAHCLFLIVPRNMFESRIGAPAVRMDGVVLKASSGPALILRRLLEGAMEAAESSTHAFRAQLGVSLMEVAAVCLQTAALTGVHDADQPVRGAALNTEDLFSLVTIFIDDNLSRRDLNGQLIQQTFSISRSGIYRMFKDGGGINSYISKRRMMMAFRLLSTTSPSELTARAIAEKTGFAEERTLRRAIQHTYGVSPSKLRLSNNVEKIGLYGKEVANFYNIF